MFSHVRVLQKLAGGDVSLHGSLLGEVVVDTVLLARSGGAGGVGNAEAELSGVVGHEFVDERALADAGGAADDDGSGTSSRVSSGGGWFAFTA